MASIVLSKKGESVSKPQRRQVTTFARTRYFGDPVKVSEGIDDLCDKVSDTVNRWIDSVIYGDPNVPSDHGNPDFEVVGITPLTMPHVDTDGHVVGVTHTLTVVYTDAAPSRIDAVTCGLPDLPDIAPSEFDVTDIESAITNLNSVQIITERLIEESGYALTTEMRDIKDMRIFTRARNNINALLTALVDINTGLTRREDLVLFEQCAQQVQAEETVRG